MKSLTRKQTLALMAATLLVTACSKQEPSLTEQKKEPVKAGELNLFAWSEYVPQGVIDGFTKETGVKVNYEAYDSNEAMLSKLITPGAKYDLIQPSEYTIEALTKEKFLLPIDAANVPNAANLLPEFRGLPHDPENIYTVTWMSGSVGICYNSEKVSDIKGFNDVFQDKYAGRIVALDDAREIVSWALAASGKDVNDITPETLALVKPTVEKWVKMIKVFDSASPKTVLLNGDCDIGIVWSGEAALCYNENPKFKYVLPVEGAHRFIDNLAIPKTCQNKAAAEAFMNYILRPEVSKLISDDFPYTNPNGATRKVLTPEQLANPASYPEGTEKLATFRDIGDISKEIDELVSNARAK